MRGCPLVDPRGLHAMPRVPGLHPGNEPTFLALIELDLPRRALGLGAAPQAGLAQAADAGQWARTPKQRSAEARAAGKAEAEGEDRGNEGNSGGG